MSEIFVHKLMQMVITFKVMKLYRVFCIVLPINDFAAV